MSENTDQEVTWDCDGWAEVSGFVMAYMSDPETGEYLCSDHVWVSKGTGLPSGAYLEQPPEPIIGKAIVRRDGSWLYVDDYRGKIAYNVSTGHPVTITVIGPLPSHLTLLKPSSPSDFWSGSEWVRDEEAEKKALLIMAEAEQLKRVNTANQQIDIIKPAVDGGYATSEHAQLLSEWQRYRYELTLVPKQSSWPSSPKWPIEPDTII